MSILSDNIRYLRVQKRGFSQRKMAEDLIITRERYAKYEDGSTEPPLEILLRFSRYYKISLDLLVTVDLRKYKLDEILKLPDNRILLPIKTDSEGENLIEVVPYKASMGYLSGYADPEYIDNLQTMSLPFLRNGKYRAFPAEGDSMPPYKDGTYVIGQYVERVSDIKVGKTHILITKTGFLFKRIECISETSITVKSNNTFYDNYDIPLTDLWEVWQHTGSYSPQELEVIDFTNQDIKSMFIKLMEEIRELKK